jgi:hypothetical protein
MDRVVAYAPASAVIIVAIGLFGYAVALASSGCLSPRCVRRPRTAAGRLDHIRARAKSGSSLCRHICLCDRRDAFERFSPIE